MSNPLPSLADPQTPEAVRADMASLSAALDATVPRKRLLAPNLLVATWNLKDFGSLTEKWTAGDNDSPKRDQRALWAIAEIVSRFDIIAIQEAGGDLRSLRTLVKTLGPGWQFLMTDVCRGSAGGGERMVFLFDTHRAQLSGLAGELVVPPEWLAEVGSDALQRQFARTPYAVSFRSGAGTMILVTLHVLYGSGSADRIAELTGIARWMADWARQSARWEHNLIVLGDFNIDRRGDALYDAFTSTGLAAPLALNDVPRSIFDTSDRPSKDRFYDQIAWFSEGGGALEGLTPLGAGSFDFAPHVYRELGLTRQQLQYRLSDHYPLWVEFGPAPV